MNEQEENSQEQRGKELDQMELEYAKKILKETELQKKEEIKRMLIELGTLRGQNSVFKKTYDEAEAKLKEQHKDSLEAIKKNKGAIGILETSLRVKALEQYDLTKEKQVGWGIVIKDKAKAEYDEKQVKAWCLEKDMFLNIDITSFLKLAKAEKFDWVKFSTTDSATLPTQIDVEALKK